MFVLQSLNVVESEEFRKLILILREGMRDHDIPHRTKMREIILTRWKEFFETVRRDLQVCDSFYLSWVHPNIMNLVCSR